MKKQNENSWKWLTDRIPAGKADAVSMPHLARVMNMNPRELRLAVEQARRAGILICSCEKGYFMPETLQEIREHAHRMDARIRTGRDCLRPFLKEIRRTEASRK